ncbi:DNA/RNA nuclease SfsA [Candidatus Moduliflexota bacterium]
MKLRRVERGEGAGEKCGITRKGLDGMGDRPGFRSRKTVEALFIGRPNRFIVHCRVGRRNVRAYLPNPGRLRELLLPGSRLFLTVEPPGSERKTVYTVVAVEREGAPVLLHTHYTNTVARWLIEHRLIPGLEEYSLSQSEITVGRSRFDFLLQKGRQHLLLEVKSCTLFGRKIAMFPDAVTARGRRHLLELAEHAGGRLRTAVLFIIHWPRAQYFLPDYHTDPAFSRTLSDVRGQVAVKPVAVGWRKDLALSSRIREVQVPWKVLEREDHDSGSYVLILRLKRRRRIEVGRLGEILFEKGYYLYAGSAFRGLGKRIERHRRGGGNPFWHIDYLRSLADFQAAFPVRSADRLECPIAESLESTADRSIPGFGASDCRCRTHLFAMDDDPLHSKQFVDLLMHYRIDRLMEEPGTKSLFPRSAGNGR